jgi:L-ribulose-5-phosphate 3-epimerase
MEYFKAMNYWTIGGFGAEKSPYQAIDDVKRLGLDGLELIFGECPEENVTEEECRNIFKYAKENGIGLRTLATGFYWRCSLSSENPEEREKAIKFTKKYIRAASWLEVDSILVVPGAIDVAWDESRPVTSYKSVWENSTESLKIVLKTAEEYKVTVCIENVWNKFLLSPIEMELFLDQFDSDYIGSYFDVGNILLYGYPEHWIEYLKNKIKAIHFKNFHRDDCGGTLHGFGEDLLKGDVSFARVMKELEKIKYKGPITAEMIPFSRLPDLVLPDMQLAENTAANLIELLKNPELYGKNSHSENAKKINPTTLF